MGGRQSWNWSPSEKDAGFWRAVKIALLSRRALVRIRGQSELARTMVASCMGMCLGVSQDLNLLLVDSLSEPILSEAAALLIGEHKLWQQLLESLLASVQYGAVDSGSLGEVAAWILFAMAWDAACIAKEGGSTPHTYTRSDVTLRDFLTALVGDQVAFNNITGTKRKRAEESKESGTDLLEEVMTRRICFTHVTQLHTRNPSSSHLKMAACRTAFAICAVRTPAIDAFAPLLPAEGNESAGLGIMQVQVKNLVSLPQSKITGWFKDMCDASHKIAGTKISGINILLHVGGEEIRHEPVKLTIDEGTGRACLLLSTDARLTLFKPAIDAVCNGNKRQEISLHDLFERLIDADRLTSHKDTIWSLDNMPDAAKKAAGASQLSLKDRTEKLLDFLFVKMQGD
jgi:hypothetical protein